jgi:hypothetical protein
MTEHGAAILVESFAASPERCLLFGLPALCFSFTLPEKRLAESVK